MPKDFAAIADDYAFFMTHATEAASDAAAYAQKLSGFAAQRAAIRMLDFGCGSGEFTERLLKLLAWPPERLALHLVEPVAQQRETAARRLANYARHSAAGAAPIVASGVPPLPSEAPAAQDTDKGEQAQPFDIVLSNHALYYVDDLADTLAKLVGLVAPGGKLLIAIAGWDNTLLELWRHGFGLLGRPVPYYTAEDVRAEFARLGVPFQVRPSHYELRFADSELNRLRILRFLFAEHLDELPRVELLAFFDRYAAGGEIAIRTWSEHLVGGIA